MHQLMGGGDAFVVLSFHMPRATIPAGLTDAEGAVLLLLLHGLPSSTIAYVRGTSCRTVANQLASIYRKLGVSSRVELAARASRGHA